VNGTGGPDVKRRTFLAASAAIPLVDLACKSQKVEFTFDGDLIGPSVDLGHAARDGDLPAPSSFEPIDVVIVGGGIAGLSAAWRLKGAGFEDFTLLELESGVGGTARSGRNGVSAYPLAAHYVVAPTRETVPMIRLLEEAGVIEGYDAKDEPIFGEEHLVRSPEERIFAVGQWWEGLYLHAGESPEDIRQYKAFFDEVDRWVLWRDAKGHRAFAVPRSKGSDDAEVRALDTMSFKDWLDARGLDSKRLRWLMDYACRDDYGARPETTSAWAGIYYFAARKSHPKEETRPVLTWPEGNGFLVNHLYERCKEQVRTGIAVTRITTENGKVKVLAWDAVQRCALGFAAKRVIFAGSMIMAGRVIPELARARGRAFFQEFLPSSWIVSNLTLRERPKEHFFSMAWDNVIRDGKGLGYVVDTHQSLRDHGPTVWTFYHALAGADIRSDWERLYSVSWRDCVRFILDDLRIAHPDLESCISRIDVMRWAHAMIRPRPHFMWSDVLEKARVPFQNIHFAHSDLSGFALFEEAQDHGLRAAEEVLQEFRKTFATWR
jgi:glycine/D-amino acid oxidase-like deaminating enzyme